MQSVIADERVSTSGLKLFEELCSINFKKSLLIVHNPGFERLFNTFEIITFASLEGNDNTREFSSSDKCSRLDDLVEISTSRSRILLL